MKKNACPKEVQITRDTKDREIFVFICENWEIFLETDNM